LKLALGTAQFGLDYGVANQQGQISYCEVQGILAQASASGVDTLDTAMVYGDSEQRLGEFGVQNWKVVSKLPAIPNGYHDIFKWVEDSVNESLRQLKVKSLYGLLLHRPQQLLEQNGDRLFSALQKIKNAGMVKNIGVSIYDPGQLDELFARFQLDIIQAPFNIIDRRLIDSGWMTRLKEKNVELHVRSVFLQGLLLMEPEARPQKFNRWSSLWIQYDAWLKQSNLTSLQSCLRFVLSFVEINKVVIGVDSQIQLKEILEAAIGPIPSLPDTIATNDQQLLNPTHWAALS